MRIRYYGHMGEKTGFGKAAEHYCMALEQAGVDVERADLGPPAITTISLGRSTRPADPWTIRHDEVDAVIVHTLPGDCTTVVRKISRIGKVAWVAYTTWEALTVAEGVAQPVMDTFDEVWVPSEASANPWREQTSDGETANVHVIPHCLPDRDFLVENHLKRNPEGRFRFYWIGAWNARKNPSGLIRAYCHEFTKADDVELYLHSHGTPIEAMLAELAATGIPQAELPAIRFNNDHLSDETMRELHARGDCFVSAARGEAWNLPCFEALVQRKHIVTTEDLGSDDYLGNTSAYRVNARKTPAWNTLVRQAVAHGAAGAELVGGQGLTSRDLWLEPDLVRFGLCMRVAYDRWMEGMREIDIHYNLGERFGYRAVAQQILTRLENLIR